MVLDVRTLMYILAERVGGKERGERVRGGTRCVRRPTGYQGCVCWMGIVYGVEHDSLLASTVTVLIRQSAIISILCRQ